MEKSILTVLAGSRFTDGFEDFDINDPGRTMIKDPMLQSKWANIAVSIRARNFTRPNLRVYKGTREVTSGPVYDLFDSPNPDLSMKALIWLSIMWYDIEGEFFWWFGGKMGFPKEIYCLSPRRMEYEAYTKKWFYTADDGQRVPMSPEEFLHVYEPNIWNPIRGVPPLAVLAMELEQDWSVNREVLARLNSSAIPQGILKTDQRLSPAQADDITAKWEQKYGRSKGNKKIAVLGQGTSFQALNENLMQYFEVSDNTKLAILTKYGIPLKVANATTEKTALSGKDSNEQYKALWSQTLIPLQAFWEGEIKTKFFNRFNLTTHYAKFDNTEIPELQEDEADLHKRLREDIVSGLLTPNEARALIKYPKVQGGDELRAGTTKPEDAGKGDAAAEGELDAATDEGADKKSKRAGTITVFPGQENSEGGSKGGITALSRFFNRLREG